MMLAVCNENLDLQNLLDSSMPHILRNLSPSELLNNPRVNSIWIFLCNYIFSTKVLKIYDNSASHQFCSRHSSHHVVCIIQIHMPCRLLVLHAVLYTNIVNRKSGPYGGNLDKNATN